MLQVEVWMVDRFGFVWIRMDSYGFVWISILIFLLTYIYIYILVDIDSVASCCVANQTLRITRNADSS